jgi:hypothetical protein
MYDPETAHHVDAAVTCVGKSQIQLHTYRQFRSAIVRVASVAVEGVEASFWR